jgi:simple sugar transport system permease protein
LVIALIGVALIIFFSAASSSFGTISNLSTVSSYVAPILLVAVAEVSVLTLGEIDLSVGGVYVLSPFLVVYLNDAGLPVAFAIILTLLISIAIGCINGLITVLLKVPSFITTLGTVFALEGFVLLSSNGIQINPAGEGAVTQVLGGWEYSSILWALGIGVILHLAFKRTTFGLHVVAVGGNETAAGESGIKVGAVKVACFAICSLLGGFLGLLDGYRIGSLNPGTDGLTLMFYGVAAAVVGGTALTGGRGTMIGAGIGAIVLGVLQDGFNILGVNAFAYQLVLGLAILAAMVLNIQMDRLRSGRRKPAKVPAVQPIPEDADASHAS